ncbi:hypothetical protein, partial [Providencia sp.]|uniref:hypothetical protein n=1 Tax=Providencia sp. TaxID=589 RepID=UPI00334137EE
QNRMSHILMYAPHDRLAPRLATTRTILNIQVTKIFFIFHAVAVLHSQNRMSHILMYAPHDRLAPRLATTRTILNIELLGSCSNQYEIKNSALGAIFLLVKNSLR